MEADEQEGTTASTAPGYPSSVYATAWVFALNFTVLRRRLQHVICQIFGEHQTCGIKGRTMQSNILIARSVLARFSNEMEPVALLQIDLEQAFDRVNYEALWQVLTHVGMRKSYF